MRIRFTLFLLLLNIALLGALWWLSNKTTSQVVVRAEKLIDFEGPEISRIHIQGKDEDQRRTLELKNDVWRITDPIDWPANFYAVQRILTHLEFVEQETQFAVTEMLNNGQSLADYGLEDPQVKLTIEGNGKSVTLAFGQMSPIEKKVYILSQDQKTIHLATGALLESLLVDLEDMRSQDIFSIPQYEVRGLTVKVDPINLTLIISREDDFWHLKAPIQTRASQRQVESIVNELRSLRLIRFLRPEEKDSSQLGLAVPSMRVTLVGNNRRQTLKLGAMLDAGSSDPQFIAQFEDSPSIFTVSAKPFIALRESQDRFREKRFLRFDPEHLTSIDIAREDTGLSLHRLESGAWQVIDPSELGQVAVQKADDHIMLDLIEQLHDLQAIRFASDAPSEADLERFGLLRPQRVVKLNNGKEHVLMVGGLNKESGLFYLKLKDEPFVYEVSSRILTLLQANPLHYQDRMIDAVPDSAQITRLSIRETASGKMLFDSALDIDQSWNSYLETLPEAESQAVADLLGFLKVFNVESYFMGEVHEDSFSLDRETEVPWSYVLEVAYRLPGSDKDLENTQQYYFTKRLGGNLQVGRASQSRHAFRLKQAFIDALFTLTFGNESVVQGDMSSEISTSSFLTDN